MRKIYWNIHANRTIINNIDTLSLPLLSPVFYSLSLASSFLTDFGPCHAGEKLCNPCCSTPILHWLPVHSRINFKIATITYKSLHSQPQATLLPCSTSIYQLEISVHPIHCFFLPSQQKQILACMLFNLPHQTSGTNYQLASSLHVPYHLSKPTLKLIIFSTHLDWSGDRAPQIRLQRFGLCVLYKLSLCLCQTAESWLKQMAQNEWMHSGKDWGRYIF